MAEIVVQKYGGSSVADVERLRRVAARVAATAREGKRVVVVVSAMGDTTDELLALARRVTPSPPRRELDMLLSAGERISMSLLAMAISELGLECISFTGSQSGILTNDRHSGARIIEIRPFRIQDELERDRVVIVAGFQGVSYKKEVTTLGRGGSDTTAVALAAALGASHCEICSDVDGVYSADPRVVSAARLLEAISYDEMRSLADFGARVLNAEAIEFARRAGILVVARAAAGGGGGTRVGPAGAAGRAVGVTGMGELTRLRTPGGAGAAAALAAALAGEGIAVKLVAAGAAECAALFSREDVPDWSAVRGRLGRALPGCVVDDAVAAATVVGAGLGADPGALAGALADARALGIEPVAVDTSSLRLTLLVPGAAPVDALVRALHRRFVEA